MTVKRIKDFYRFVRSVESFTDGQVRVLGWDEAELKEVSVQIQPNDGDYEGGRFDFTIKLANDFPETYPEVNCETEIYHPNIDPTSDNYNVCLSLFDEWNSSFGMRDVIQGLLFLFYEPNVDDPLSSYFGDSLTPEEFTDRVRASLRGEDVDDYEFPWNYYGKDPEMLKHKPKKVEKVAENAEAKENKTNETAADDITARTEESEENNNEVNKEENTNENEETEINKDNDSEAKENGDSVENAENVENKEETEEKTAQPDVTAVTEEPAALDINVIIEKVSELMLQYPEEEEEAGKEKENTAEETSTEAGNGNGEVANNVVETSENNEEVRDEAECANNADDSNGATENIDAGCGLQRQTSKIERQCSVTSQGAGAKDNASEEITTTDNYTPFAQYMDSFRTSPFVSPEFAITANIIGLACFCLYKSYKT